MIFDLFAMAVAVVFLLAALTVGLWLLKGLLILAVGMIVLPLKLGWWVVKGVFGLVILALVASVVLSIFGPLLAILLPLALVLVVLPILGLATFFGRLCS